MARHHTALSSQVPTQSQRVDSSCACGHHQTGSSPGMQSLRVTNWLLLGIVLALFAHLLGMTSTPVLAEMYLPKERMDTCITDHPNEKPIRYLHVVTHTFSGDSR